ncbi:hypothetical protein IAQ61_011737 [Plenodomus lingam]|uniref:uncharacterized protein n=1 Tax=Leptosphaeria maculans TaxID=5022 RepID=UPI003333064B|nr:hypothetical protein IAQ61_011737 [Plenodomus lingam]
MEIPPLQPQPLSARSKILLKKLRATLKSRNLLHLLDSLPSPMDISMKRTNLRGKSAIQVWLGSRPQSNGTLVPVYGIVITDNKDESPHVRFGYESPGFKQLQPRSACYMVRKAGAFVLPFRFLQYDPTPEDTKGGGDMLCALVWYYVLIAGHGDHALHWPLFEKSLGRAVKHIDAYYEYHEWINKQPVAPGIVTAAGILNREGQPITSIKSSTSLGTRVPRAPLVLKIKNL